MCCTPLIGGLLALLTLAAPSARAIAQQSDSELPAPALTGDLAPLVPTAFAQALRCRPKDDPSPPRAVVSKSVLSCGVRLSTPGHGEPFSVFVDLNPDGRITYLMLDWGVGGAPGEDSVRTVRLDSAYAAAKTFVQRRLGPPVICRGTVLWRTASGILVLTPPRRGMMHSTPSYPPQPPGPEYASWDLLVWPRQELLTADACATSSHAP
jgi:hypothetical protein